MTTTDFKEKFIISLEETAIYEVFANSAEEAQAIFESGGGDFIGWDETRGREIRVERFEPRY